jgi:hypothetical protein
MGGKGGGGQNYYQQPADVSGYSTPEEAAATLAATAPLDMSKFQQTINTQKAAAGATAPTPSATDTANADAAATGAGDVQIGGQLADSVLAQPAYWSDPAVKGSVKPRDIKQQSATTTQT